MTTPGKQTESQKISFNGDTGAFEVETERYEFLAAFQSISIKEEPLMPIRTLKKIFFHRYVQNLYISRIPTSLR